MWANLFWISSSVPMSFRCSSGPLTREVALSAVFSAFSMLSATPVTEIAREPEVNTLPSFSSTEA